jgi:hypothetical protein
MKQLTLSFQEDSESTGEMTTSSSPVDSRASRTALQEKEKAKKTLATYGLRCLEQYGRFNQHTSWGKTFMGLLIGTGDWFSTRRKLTWKMKATKSSRLYFQLVPSTPRTEGTGYGFWPTAQTQGLKICNSEGKTEFINLRLLPTPKAKEGVQTKGRKLTLKDGKYKNISHTTGLEYGIELSQLAQNGLLPTPNASDNRDRGGPKDKCIQRRIKLGKQVGLTQTVDGQLNPLFVGEMMGYPTDWLISPFMTMKVKNQIGTKKQSKHSETQ